MMATLMTYWVGLSAVAAMAAYLLDFARRRTGGALRWIWVFALLVGSAAPLVRPAIRATGRLLSRPTSTVQVPDGDTRVPVRMDRPERESGHAAARAPLSRLDLPLLALWLCASLAMAVVLGRAALRLRTLRRQWVPATVAGHRVLIAPHTGPAVAGMGERHIVLPAWALTAPEEQQRLMLLHEREHVQAGDPWLLLLALVVLVALPWSPVLWWVARRLRAAVEIDCDARVLHHAPDVDDYGALLLQVARRRSGRTDEPLLLPATALLHPTHLLEERIHMMTSNRRTRRSLITSLALTAVVVVPAVGLATTVPSPRMEPIRLGLSWSEDSATVLRARSMMKTALRRLVGAQEAYFAEHGRYAPDIAALATLAKSPPFVPPHGLTLRLIWAAPNAWSASATSPEAPGISCTDFVAFVPERGYPLTAREKQIGEEGAPVCDGDRPIQRTTWLAYARESVKWGLENANKRQEAFRARTGAFSDSAFTNWKRFDPDVHVRYLSMSPTSWSAEATFERAPGKSCVIWAGDRPGQLPVTKAGKLSEAAGKAVCDEL
jgi:hypothetical protein